MFSSGMQVRPVPEGANFGSQRCEVWFLKVRILVPRSAKPVPKGAKLRFGDGVVPKGAKITAVCSAGEATGDS